MKLFHHQSSLDPVFCRLLIQECGDILHSDGMRLERHLIQHGTVSVYEHSLRVAYVSYRLSRQLGIHVDERALLRGALLHDYFLYDWHEPEDWHRLHGFRHPGFAAANAARDFTLTPVEADIIRRHMFPLTPKPPRYRESVIVCLSDKLCASAEVFRRKSPQRQLSQ